LTEMTRDHQLKAAEFAHKPHTKTDRVTLGAPYSAEGAFNTLTWDARWHFSRAIEAAARQDESCRSRGLFEDLAKLFKRYRCKIPESSLGKWARGYNLLHDGKPSTWLLSAARTTVAIWDFNGTPMLGLVPGVVGFPEGRAPLARDACRIILPQDLFWEPFQATRQHDGRTRLETRYETRERIMRLVDLELDRIETLATRAGGTPTAGGRVRQMDPEAFLWAVRYQINDEPIATIAGNYAHQRAVDKAVLSVLRLVELDRRAGVGRPKK
jgi:hypothetical protein